MQKKLQINGLLILLSLLTVKATAVVNDGPTPPECDGPTPCQGDGPTPSPSPTPLFNEITSPTTGKIWMDRNLGASQVATSSTDSASYGYLYQWGREADGHQVRSSSTTSTVSGTNQPGHGDFIIGSNNWLNPEQNNVLWQGVNGVNNPCPTGFRIPTEAEWTDELISNSQTAFSSLKLPLGGFRRFTDNTIVDTDTIGYYWSSNVAFNGLEDRPIRFAIFSGGAVFNTFSHAYGQSVRCIKN